MPKLKAPLLSLDATGKLAKIFTYLTRRGQHIVEMCPIPTDAKSPAQLFNRHMFNKCIALWHLLSSAEQQEWESLARRRHMSGYAWFISQCLRPNPGIYLPLQGGTMAGDIDMAKYRLLKLPLPVDNQEPLTLAYYTANIAPYLYNEGARVFHNVDQAIPHGVGTILAFNSQSYDTDNIHDTVLFNSRLTCRTTGKYIISFTSVFAANAVGVRTVALLLNGVSYLSFFALNATIAGASYLILHALCHLTASWSTEIVVVQNSGVPLNLKYIAGYSPYFSMQRIGA